MESKVARVQPVNLYCPQCKRWLAEVVDYGRVVCRDCGGELVWTARDRRVLDKPHTMPIE